MQEKCVNILIWQLKEIILSRSAIFLHKTYADFHKLAKDQVSYVQPTDDGLTIGDVLPNPNKPIEHNDDNENNLDNLVEDIPDDLSDEDYTTVASEEDIVPLNITNRRLRELRNFQTYYNPDPLQYIGDNSINVALQATIYNGNPDPKSYGEAVLSDDWPNWWGAICTEFQSIHDNQVWKIIHKITVPYNRNVLGQKCCTRFYTNSWKRLSGTSFTSCK
jgi:hypothetical protein